MNGKKQRHMMETYKGFRGDETIKQIISFMPVELVHSLTGRELGFVATAINAAYLAGKASTGADMIDENCVWINRLKCAIEWTEEGAEWETKVNEITDDKGVIQKVYEKVKVKPGQLIPRFLPGNLQ